MGERAERCRAALIRRKAVHDQQVKAQITAKTHASQQRGLCHNSERTTLVELPGLSAYFKDADFDSTARNLSEEAVGVSGMNLCAFIDHLTSATENATIVSSRARISTPSPFPSVLVSTTSPPPHGDLLPAMKMEVCVVCRGKTRNCKGAP